MPLYSYICDRHGLFDDWRSMSESGAPTACPACGKDAARAISAPALSCMDGSNRKAHYINERSADSPKVVSKAEPGHPENRGKGGHGHAHGHPHSHAHSHGPSRPWMIGH